MKRPDVGFERGSNGGFERGSNCLRTCIRTGFERVFAHTPLTPQRSRPALGAGSSQWGTPCGEKRRARRAARRIASAKSCARADWISTTGSRRALPERGWSRGRPMRRLAITGPFQAGPRPLRGIAARGRPSSSPKNEGAHL